MKVILLNRYFYPDLAATSQFLSDLAFHLATEGYDTYVITSRLRYDDAIAKLIAWENIQGVQVHRVWTSSYGRDKLYGRALDYLSFYLSATRHLWKLTRAGDLVIAKTDPPLVSVAAALVCTTRRAFLVNWVQDLFPEVASVLGVRGVCGWRMAVLRWLRNWSLYRAKKNVALGEGMAARLRANGVAQSRVTIIQNWADGQAVYPVAPGQNVLRRAWALDDKFVVGYSGNMGLAHDFQTVIDAAELLKECTGLMFLFVGGGAQMAHLRTEATRREMSNVLFCSYQPRDLLAESLSVPDVHLISLRPALEGFIVPSKFYGIAAVGRPCLFVGDPEGETGRLIREAECGLVVRPGQAEELAERILTLQKDAELRRRMGDNARTLLERYFDKPIAMAKWRAVVELARREALELST